MSRGLGLTFAMSMEGFDFPYTPIDRKMQFRVPSTNGRSTLLKRVRYRFNSDRIKRSGRLFLLSNLSGCSSTWRSVSFGRIRLHVRLVSPRLAERCREEFLRPSGQTLFGSVLTGATPVDFALFDYFFCKFFGPLV